jgi:hypothetical protein
MLKKLSMRFTHEGWVGRDDYEALRACGGASSATIAVLYYAGENDPYMFDNNNLPNREHPKYIYSLHFPIQIGMLDELRQLDEILRKDRYNPSPEDYWYVWSRGKTDIEYTLKQHRPPEPLEITIEISLEPGSAFERLLLERRTGDPLLAVLLPPPVPQRPGLFAAWYDGHRLPGIIAVFSSP